MKKLFILVLVAAMMFSATAFASTNKPLKNLGQGLDDMVYGKMEVPDNINETGSKGSPAYDSCTEKTNDDFGRGVARFVGGAWRIVTFWYPEDDANS